MWGEIYKVSHGTQGDKAAVPWPDPETTNSQAPGASVCLLFMPLVKCLAYSSFSGKRMSLSLHSLYLQFLLLK